MSDCPLAPHKEYRQGYPDGTIKTVPYIAPCKDWDGANCNWFEPPQKVSGGWRKIKREVKGLK